MLMKQSGESIGLDVRFMQEKLIAYTSSKLDDSKVPNVDGEVAKRAYNLPSERSRRTKIKLCTRLSVPNAPAISFN